MFRPAFLLFILLKLLPLAAVRAAPWKLAPANAAAADSMQYLLNQAKLQGEISLPAARRFARRALVLARRTARPQDLSNCYHRLGIIEQFAGHDLPAQRYFEQALALARQAHSSLGQANAYLGLGFVAFNQNDIRTALRWYQRADAAYAAQPPAPGTDSLRLSQRLKMRINLASAYLELHLPDSAGRICRQALALPGVASQPVQVNGLLQNLGEVQLSAHHPDSARLTLTQGLRMAHSATDSAGMLSRLAVANLALHQPLAARQQALLALAIARRSGVVEDRSDALETLAAALQALHRPEAYDTLRSYLRLHDTLLANARTEAVAQAQVRFNSREQQAQIQALQQSRRLAAQAQELEHLRTQRQLIGLSALTLLVLLLAGGVVWQYRRRQARRDARLRTQIAADLHDDVGTLLSQISLQSSLLQEGVMDAQGQRQQLGQISEASRSAVRQLNDVVWSLDAHNDALPALLDRLRDYAHEVLSPAGIGVVLHISAMLPAQALPITLRRHLYLIYKEALHNVLKHARGATQVTISLTPVASPASLLLEVRDNAPPTPALVPTGFTVAPNRRSGHGLRNIAERASALGGTATCAPLPGGGFQVSVRIPY